MELASLLGVNKCCLTQDDNQTADSRMSFQHKLILALTSEEMPKHSTDDNSV